MVSRRRPLQRGMTLVELLIGLAITGMIGAAIAAMLSAVSYGTRSDHDLRRLAARHKAIDARLGDAIRYSRMALASYTAVDGSLLLVLWTGDARVNSSPNRSEIRVLRFHPGAGDLASYKAAPPAGGWTDANDTKYQFDTNFAATVVPGFLSGTPEVWASGVAALDLRFGRLDTGTPTPAQVQAAKLISYRVTLGPADAGAVVVGAARMRNAD